MAAPEPTAKDAVMETEMPPDSGSEWMLIDDDAKAASKALKAPSVQGLQPDSELDLCFLCDCTGSMGQYIKAAQDNIQSIVSKIGCHGANVRFGLISYRDHPPQEKSYVTQCHPFTDDIEKMRGYVHSMTAQGGGDGPEAVTAALFAALSMPWRPNATKICVLIADAPPHGLEPSGDGFPNGDPDGHDPLQILRDMTIHGITCYSVGCEPALGSYRFARDFLCNVAEVTGGQAVALSSAAMLADVIINGSAEELALAKLQRKVEEEVQKVQEEARSLGKDVTTEESVSTAVLNLHALGVTSVQMQTDGHMHNATRACWGDVRQKKSLAAVKADLAKVPSSVPVPSGKGCPAPRAGYPAAWGNLFGAGDAAPSSAPAAAVASSNVLKTDLISPAQVSRLVQKAQCQDRLL